MTYYAQIQEAAAKFGLDEQTARDLHRELCHSDEPGAQFAAELVRQIIELTTAASQKISLLASLAQEAAK